MASVSPFPSADVDLKRFDNIQENLEMLSLVMDEPTCLHLQLLADRCPRTLAVAQPERMTTDQKFIQGKRDFEAIDYFLDGLAQSLKR